MKRDLQILEGSREPLLHAGVTRIREANQTIDTLEWTFWVPCFPKTLILGLCRKNVICSLTYIHVHPILRRAAISLEPKVAIYYGNRAAASFMLGKYKEALDDSLTSTKLDPAYARGYQRAAKAYLTLGRLAQV